MAQKTANKVKSIYLFEEGSAQMKDILGGKGSGLAEMTRMGFPVPPGFTITTAECINYTKTKKLSDELKKEIKDKMKVLESKMNQKFGSTENPLLISVRSGAKFSMPGMMDTILNLGLNEETVKGLAKLSGDDRFTYDSYRRFITMFSDVVLELDKKHFEALMREKKKELNVTEDWKLTPKALKELIKEYKAYVKKQTGADFPESVYDQLYKAVEAVFKSWDNPRAIVYREKEKIPHNLGTAINIQVMVFGNLGEKSGTGVAFTRDASTGKKGVVGDFLFKAQGEDVVAGIRTPLHIQAMKESQPEIYKQLVEMAEKLEKHYRDLQDIEFTIQQGKLYMLQTRSAKRTAQAAIKVAVDMVKEGLITKEEAVLRVTPDKIDQMLHPYFSPEELKKAESEGKLLAKGTAASPGAATGLVAFDAERAVELSKTGESVILVRPETTPDDAQGMLASKGILTSTGGPTSHAALVARGWGIPCVVGCEVISIDVDKKEFSIEGKIYKELEAVSLDGSTGEVFLGKLLLVAPSKLSGEIEELLKFADEIRTLGVYANADNPKDAGRAREFGAEGIGLCRTEHMFMEAERLPIAQEMILAAPEAVRFKAASDRLKSEIAESPPAKKKELKRELEKVESALKEPWARYQGTLDKLMPIQKGDFLGILKAMEGCWTIIRLLDPPLHEFLPNYEELLVEVTTLRLKGGNPEELKEKEKLLESVRALREFNPMLGLRVCRLGIVYPEIYKMQIRAIMEAACELKSQGIDVKPEIMIPGVCHKNEMKFTYNLVKEVAEAVIKEKGVKVDYKIGTMIELPRACTNADELAEYAQFFSFGTNDLTQTTFGYSRDDASGTFIPVYLEKHILKDDPFQVLDTEGVGQLMKMAIKKGRKARPDLEIGICGEHGGEPRSVEFCNGLGLNYVSCSPFRVPIARLSAAQAKIKEEAKTKVSDTR